MKQKRGLIVFFLITSLVALFVFDNFFNLALGNRIGTVLRPIGIVFEDIGSNISGFFRGFVNIGNLQKENTELKDKLNQALVEVAKLSDAQKENLALKRDLGFKNDNGFELVAAKVVFFDPSNIRDTITINVGSRDGIKNNNVVISEGFLVGRVIDVKETSAKIKLISDPDSAVPSTVISSNITGITKGKIGNGLELEQVPQSEKVNQADKVVTSGLGGEYPKGLIIGKIEEVQKISGSIFQQIIVKPIIDLTKLERVMVIKS